MKYQGNKTRFAKEIIEVLKRDNNNLKNLVFCEPFCGSASVTQCFYENLDEASRKEVKFIISDKNLYLTNLWQYIKENKLKNLPENIDKDLYVKYKELYKENYKGDNFTMAMIGYIGFVASFNGKFYEGYSKTTKSKTGVIRNYIKEAINNLIKQISQSDWLFNENLKINYDNDGDYLNFEKLIIDGNYNRENIIIYCDIPYRDTTGYKSFSKNFEYEKFYEWCITMKNKGYKVYISEYSMPEELFECIWKKETKCSLNTNGYKGLNKIEKLFKVK